MLNVLDFPPVVAGFFGLLVGSFLNVVIYRLPKMLELEWAAERQVEQASEAQKPATFNLVVPRSTCPQCGHPIKWYENVPVLSYIALRGKCAQCKTSISARYPVVEVATGLAFYFCGTQWGLSYTTLAWCLFSASLLSLALIDWDTTLLPDSITLPLLWAGLITASLRWTQVDLNSAVWGAVLGYGSLWLIYWGFKLVTGKEGMGYGDFKLFGALGAWFGWQGLIPIILFSSVLGAVVGIGMKFTSGLREGGYIPFGPFLAGAGFAMLFLGPTKVHQLLGI
jgi:leader peptidase (prepilin peptidase)/N-methyltransferase